MDLGLALESWNERVRAGYHELLSLIHSPEENEGANSKGAIAGRHGVETTYDLVYWAEDFIDFAN